VFNRTLKLAAVSIANRLAFAAPVAAFGERSHVQTVFATRGSTGAIATAAAVLPAGHERPLGRLEKRLVRGQDQEGCVVLELRVAKCGDLRQQPMIQLGRGETAVRLREFGHPALFKFLPVRIRGFGDPIGEQEQPVPCLQLDR
jgi:hypothetical protein